MTLNRCDDKIPDFAVACRMTCPVCSAALEERRIGSSPILYCPSCTVHVTHPSLRRDDDASFYEKDYTLTQTVRSSTERHRYFRYPEYYKLIGELSALQPPPGRWLDIGCDHGFFIDEVRRNGYDVAGVEPSQRARAYARRIGLDVEADVANVQGRWSVISMWHVLEHIGEPRAMIDRCIELLEPDGILCIRVPDFASAWRHVFGARWIWYQPGVHLVHYTDRALRQLVESSGLTVELVRRQHPNTLLTCRSYGLSTTVFRRYASLPSPSSRDRIARLYQDVTGAEIFIVARKRQISS